MAMIAGGADACSICGASRRFLYLWNGYRLYRCERCGTESVSPLPPPQELASFYQGISGKKTVGWERRLMRVRRAFDRYLRIHRRITGSASPERFADSAGAVGYHVRAAQGHGVDAWLVDWAGDALDFARDRLGVANIVAADVQRCADELEPASFDFVLARHVIEHMRDPQAFADHLARITRPSGVLQVETPNVDSWEQIAHPGVVVNTYSIIRRSNPALSALGAGWRAATKSVSGVNPVKHLWGFTAEGVRLLLERHGFAVVEVHREPAGHPVFDPLYYELHRLSARSGSGVPYYFWERAVSPLFRGRGMNLAVTAVRRNGAATPRPSSSRVPRAAGAA